MGNIIFANRNPQGLSEWRQEKEDTSHHNIYEKVLKYRKLSLRDEIDENTVNEKKLTSVDIRLINHC